MAMKIVSQILGLFLILALASPSALAATYKYQDESGNTVYSQKPPENPNTPYEILDDISSGARAGSSSSSSSNSASAPPTPDPQQDEEQNDIAAQEEQQAEKIREKNCEAAKKNLEIYTVYRRVRNDEGVIERVDENVRQQKIEEAKQAIQDFCD